jgi:predicted alpha/beta-hydrolase family hydrolase
MRDSAELTLVCDPFAHRHALLARYEFRIDAVEARERFHLTPEDPEEDRAA